VARDISGARFRNLTPFVVHPPSRARLQAGLPFPALCCWNGLAAIGAAPFVELGLRFRGALPGECRASECSLLCDDLQRLGRRRVVVDPGVRVAYEWEQALQLSAAAMRGGGGGGAGGVPSGLGPVRGWSEVGAAEVQEGVNGEWRPGFDRVDCCNLAPGHSYVNFRKDCRPQNILAKNFTHAFLKTRSVQQG